MTTKAENNSRALVLTVIRLSLLSPLSPLSLSVWINPRSRQNLIIERALHCIQLLFSSGGINNKALKLIRSFENQSVWIVWGGETLFYLFENLKDLRCVCWDHLIKCASWNKLKKDNFSFSGMLLELSQNLCLPSSLLFKVISLSFLFLNYEKMCCIISMIKPTDQLLPSAVMLNKVALMSIEWFLLIVVVTKAELCANVY